MKTNVRTVVGRAQKRGLSTNDPTVFTLTLQDRANYSFEPLTLIVDQDTWCAAPLGAEVEIELKVIALSSHRCGRKTACLGCPDCKAP